MNQIDIYVISNDDANNANNTNIKKDVVKENKRHKIKIINRI